MEMQHPTLAGISFNDVFRYMNWHLTVPFFIMQHIITFGSSTLGVDAYKYFAGKLVGGTMEMQNPTLPGIIFNDANRYMNWHLTVQLLCMFPLASMMATTCIFGLVQVQVSRTNTRGLSSSPA